MMLVIGLTGGIASGKSTVAQLFKELGVPVINADHIAKELTVAGSPALQKIVAHFGSGILDHAQELNRRLLREKIMTQPQEKLWLEQLLHPLIRQEIARRVKEIKAPYCVIEIPLLVETGFYPYINRILVVDVDEATQLARLQARDDLSLKQAQQILANQALRTTRLDKADDILLNQSNLAELEKSVNDLHLQYLQLSTNQPNIE